MIVNRYNRLAVLLADPDYQESRHDWDEYVYESGY